MRQILAGITAAFLLALAAWPASAQDGPLRIDITEGVIEPVPVALPQFIAESGGAEEMARQVTQVIADDLTGTGLFRRIPQEAFISSVSSFSSPVQYADWKAINAQALVTGAVSVEGGRVIAKFRLYDVFAGTEMGEGMQFAATESGWRRLAHKVADQVYSRITGEGGYFDSRVVFVSESGPKDERAKRIAVMDYDGANVQYLTDSGAIVLAPRFSPDGNRVIYTSYQTGSPRIHMLNVGDVQSRVLPAQPGR